MILAYTLNFLASMVLNICGVNFWYAHLTKFGSEIFYAWCLLFIGEIIYKVL
jgi:K+ transporter